MSHIVLSYFCLICKIISCFQKVVCFFIPNRVSFAKKLDFTTPSRLGSDLNDVFQLVGKLRRGDVVKVTLNAHTASIPSNGAKSELEKPRKRLEHLENAIGDYLPIGTNADMITNSAYPKVLFDSLKLAIDKGMAGSRDEYFQPLTSFVYADGMQMMTFTGIILNLKETKSFFRATEIGRWDLSVIEPVCN